MVTRLSCFLLLVATACSALRADPELKAVSLPTTFEPEPGVRVQVSLKKQSIRLQINKEKPIVIGELDAEFGLTGNKPVIVADFNFDGALDLAVLDGIGYNGVNLFYRLFLWEKGKLHFREMNEPVANPVLKKSHALVLSAQRSGPRWYRSLFRVLGGEMYRFAEGEMLNTPTLWGIVFADEQGKPGKRAVVGEKWFDNPVIPIKPPEADYSPAFCNDAKVSPQGGADKKSKRVLLLDFRTDQNEVRIQEPGQKDSRWVSLDCLSGG